MVLTLRILRASICYNAKLLALLLESTAYVQAVKMGSFLSFVRAREMTQSMGKEFPTQA